MSSRGSLFLSDALLFSRERGGWTLRPKRLRVAGQKVFKASWVFCVPLPDPLPFVVVGSSGKRLALGAFFSPPPLTPLSTLSDSFSLPSSRSAICSTVLLFTEGTATQFRCVVSLDLVSLLRFTH